MELFVHAAALSPRPHGPGAADLRLHVRVLRYRAVGLGPHSACSLPPPAALQGTCRSATACFPTYRLFLIVLRALRLALLLWLFLERSRLGAMVRAGVDDAAMAAGLGANIPALVYRRLRRRRGPGRARRRRCRPDHRPLSRHGRRDSDPGVHRHRDRRHGQPARRLHRQPADRRGRYVRQGLSAEHGVVSDLSRRWRSSCWCGRRACSASNIPASRPQPPSLRPSAPTTTRTRIAGAASSLAAMLIFPFVVSNYPRALLIGNLSSSPSSP